MKGGFYDFSDLRFRPEAYRDQQGRVHEVQRADMTFANGVGVRVRLGMAVKGSDGVNLYQTRIMRDGKHWVLNPMTKCGPAYWCSEAKVSYLMRQAQEYRSLRGTLNPLGGMTATLDTIEQAPDYTGTLRCIPVGAERHYPVESSRAYLSLSTARTRLHTAGEGRYEFSMDWKNNVLTVKRLA